MSDDRNYDAIADPELIARLAAWFGEGPLPRPDPERLERDARDAALAEVEAVMDEEMCERLESRRGSFEVLLNWANSPLDSAVDVQMPRGNLPFPEPVDFEEPDEYEQPDDIRHALRDQNTPQAVLRDLYRPVIHFGDVWLHQPRGPGHVGGDPTAVIKEAMETTWGIPDWRPAHETIEIDLGGLRSSLSEPWADSAIDPADRQSDDDDDDPFFWMGMSAGYDPDL